MIKYLEDLDEFVKKNNIDKSDICIVGSAVFSNFGIRNNNDLDIILKPKMYRDISKQMKLKIGLSGYCSIGDNLDLYRNRYYIIGISDEKIFEDKLFYYFESYKVVIPEIECSYKSIIKRYKDIKDIEMLKANKSLVETLNQSLIEKIISENTIKLYIRRFTINMSNIAVNPRVLGYYLKNKWFQITRIIINNSLIRRIRCKK